MGNTSKQNPANDLANYPEKFVDIQRRIRDCCARAGREPADITVTAVSKKFDAAPILPVLAAGHRVFGENRVQEAARKWPPLKAASSDKIELRLIGPLQTNKAREAVALFDVIETLDRERLARHLAEAMDKYAKHIPCYVQVNIGEEPQKAGIAPREAEKFVTLCRQSYGLSIDGVMCLPPAGQDPAPYFALLEKIAHDAGVCAISMGMSGDFETAIEMGATHIRIGSGIFGPRPR